MHECKGPNLPWPQGKLLFWGIREDDVAKSSYRRLLPVLPALLQRVFLGFGLGFFSVWKPELKYSQGSQIAICVPLPSCFFLIFPLQKNKSILKPWHFPVPSRSEGQAGTQQQLDSCKLSGGSCCKGKSSFLLRSSCSFEHNLCSTHCKEYLCPQQTILSICSAMTMS